MGKMEKDIEKQADASEPYQESSDESFAMDSQMDQRGRLPSNISPEDYYQYKKFVNLPESQAEFSTKIDKDVVFGNFGGSLPTMEELRFEIGTIELFESEFVEELLIPRRDQFGNLVKDREGKLILDTEIRFDENFRGCLNFLKAEYKFAVVASRAIGKDRASMLDISNVNKISKEFSRKKEGTNKTFGFGGM